MTNLLTLYKTMVTIRLLENKLQEMCFKGEAGDLHFNRGQEAISVGVCAALKPTDYIVTHHRTIAHSVAKGSPLYPLIAEVLGRATGVNKGLAGEMHINNPSIRYMFSFQLVGTCIPVATGLAWALRYYRKTQDIVAVFFGDAASSNGQMHEALNIAKIRHAPLLLICENNGRAGNITKDYYLPTKTVAERMAAYSIGATTIDGNYVSEVVRATEAAVSYVRSNSEPFLIEMNTTRLCHHKQGMGDIRTREEIQKLAERDPLLLAERRIDMTQKTKETIWQNIEKELDTVFEKAKEDPWSSVSHIW